MALQNYVNIMGRWVIERMGIECLLDKRERAARLLEEATEFAQSEGLGEDMAYAILARVFTKEPGESNQEAAGVFTVLMAWAASRGVDIEAVVQAELERIHKLDPARIHAKRREKIAEGIAFEHPVPNGDVSGYLRGDLVGPVDLTPAPADVPRM